MLVFLGMMASHGCRDGTNVLSLEIIDETGEVVDTVYVGEITGTSGTMRAVQPASDPTTRGRDD